MKTNLIISSIPTSLIIITLLGGVPAWALTTSGPDYFQTDFSGANVTTNFCDGAIMDTAYNSNPNGLNYTVHTSESFNDGSLTLSARYANDAYKALISGGARSSTLVPIAQTNKVDAGIVTDYAYGMFGDSIAKMAYTLYNPGTSYTNGTAICVYLASRKNDTPPTLYIGPFSGRVPTYLVWFDGKRLSIGEYTYLNGASPREIAGVNVAVTSTSSTFKLVLSVNGGSDNGGVLAGASPCLLFGELWEGSTRIARIEGQDNPYNWVSGPEVAGSVFSAAGDYNYGAWSLFAGDWDDFQSWTRGNHDIRLTGWIVFGVKQLTNIGTMQGIVVDSLSVTPAPQETLVTVLVVR